MSIVEDVLRNIPDSTLLSKQKAPSILALVAAYQERMQVNDDLPRLTETFTGRDLKEAIGKLAAEDQVTLLHNYNVASHQAIFPGPAFTPEQLEAAEDKKLKRFMIKGLFFTAIGILISIVVAVAIVGTIRGDVDLSVVNGLITTAVEIIKLIFSNATIS